MWRLTLLLIFCQEIFFCLVLPESIGDKCSPTVDISAGECKVVTDCPQAISYLMRRVRHPYSRCGFQDLLEVVCCPRSSIEKFDSTERVPRPTTQRTPNTRNKKRKSEIECERIAEEVLVPLVPHIVGGEDAFAGEFPHMAALGYETGENDEYEFKCGGALISKWYVMTAAHCVQQRARPTIVRLGVVDISWSGRQYNTTTDYRIARIVPHPEYNPPVKYHDLALLRLDRAVVYNGDNVSACCLYTGEPGAAGDLTVTGWGTTSATRTQLSPMLQKASVSLVERGTCAATYGRSLRMPEGVGEGQLCASGGKQDACQGDSGGPLQSLGGEGRARVLGVTSSGRGCAGVAPGLYTSVPHYLDWIESIVWP